MITSVLFTHYSQCLAHSVTICWLIDFQQLIDCAGQGKVIKMILNLGALVTGKTAERDRTLLSECVYKKPWEKKRGSKTEPEAFVFRDICKKKPGENLSQRYEEGSMRVNPAEEPVVRSVQCCKRKEGSRIF